MIPGYLYFDHCIPEPGARIVPSIALALTCRQICQEFLAIAVAAQQVYIEGYLGWKTESLPDSVTPNLDIYITLDFTGARVVEIVGIDIVDGFGCISIHASPGWREDEWSRGR